MMRPARSTGMRRPARRCVREGTRTGGALRAVVPDTLPSPLAPRSPLPRLIPLLTLLWLAPPALADDIRDAEQERLVAQMHSLAQKNVWQGVERTYDQLVDQGYRVDRETLLLAAEAARNRGDVMSRMARLVEAQYRQNDPALAGAIEDLSATFGRVQLSGEGALDAAATPFRPDAQQAFVGPSPLCSFGGGPRRAQRTTQPSPTSAAHPRLDWACSQFLTLRFCFLCVVPLECWPP